jgi:hypothetical protein
MLNQHKIPFVYTVESSTGLYYSQAAMKTLPFTRDIW